MKKVDVRHRIEVSVLWSIVVLAAISMTLAFYTPKVHAEDINILGEGFTVMLTDAPCSNTDVLTMLTMGSADPKTFQAGTVTFTDTKTTVEMCYTHQDKGEVFILDELGNYGSLNLPTKV